MTFPDSHPKSQNSQLGTNYMDLMFLNTYAGAHQNGAQGHLPHQGRGHVPLPRGSGTFSKFQKFTKNPLFRRKNANNSLGNRNNSARKTSNIARSVRENLAFRSHFSP